MKGGDDVAAGVVSTVSEQTGTPEDTLPPLYESIEPEALDDMVNHANRMSDTELLVQFQYAGCEITIQGPSDIEVDA